VDWPISVKRRGAGMPNKFNLREQDFIFGIRVVFALCALILFTFAITEYKGAPYVYLVFSIASNGLIYFGFRKNAIFFDTFISLFLWLGFWLKLSVRVAFADSEFHESVGNFSGSGTEFDAALLATSVAFTGLMVASYLRAKFFFQYPTKVTSVTQHGLHQFYTKYRLFVLIAFAFLIVLVTVTNIYFGFYQRGSLTRTVLPFGLNGVYKWLILFGLASFSALIIKFEYFDNQKNSYLVAFLALFETFASNVALLSRGMILNSSALVYGFYRSSSLNRIKFRLQFFVVCSVVLIVLFAASVVGVNTLRSSAFYDSVSGTGTGTGTGPGTGGYSDAIAISRTTAHTKLLFLDRWVGIEGVLAVSSYSGKGWDLFWAGLQEKYHENRLSFYDSHLIVKDTPYINTDFSKHHFVSLPGVVAFNFYSGSFLFLFFSMLLAGFFAFLVELFVYKLGGRNLILCALIGQVVAFRYASFGYVPAQSYLLFGTIFLNVILIYLADKIFASWFRRN